MAVNIRVKFDVSRTLSMFQALPRNIQKEIGNGMFDIAKSYQRGLRFSLRRNSQRFKNKIFNGIKAKKISNNQSIVNMPIEGIYLDDMRPHVVALKRGRLITQWAREKGIKAKYLHVRAHPFIVQGYNRGRRSREKIMQRSMDLAIKNSRR